MDKRIENKKRKHKRLVFIALGIVTFFVSSLLLFNPRDSIKSVDRSRLRLSVVKEDLFVHSVSVTATVEPNISVMLDAVEGGTVVEKLVEPGEKVVEGQELLRLSNTNLTLDFMNRETQIIEQINNLRNTRIQMELNEQDLKEKQLDIEYELAEIERNHSIQELLYSDSVIAKNEFVTSQQRFHYLKNKQQLITQNLEQTKNYRALQLSRIDFSIELMERNLTAIRSNLEQLVIKAPLTGTLTSLNAEIGESKMRGENLGRIDQIDNYKLASLVDEHFLNQIHTGLNGTFTLHQQDIQLSISKVFPEVVNNQFRIECEFLTPIDSLDLKRGQNVNLTLQLGHPKKAILVERGAFFNTTGGTWIYVLTEENKAEKREISVGLQNNNYFEVKSGLQPGDQVITSSYSTFENAEILQLN